MFFFYCRTDWKPDKYFSETEANTTRVFGGQVCKGKVGGVINNNNDMW